ncbi:type II toxin-antitoxin system RelE/ParE family toxin [Burkholderia cenocepacia]|uniref:type II toxin-antitoxin system RelE/ParE family toxin n=3 Tax=Burkholderia cenocepacia TaxID=95486 RepID=UPI0009818A3B|nr:type II toxin-antitoxin system RelE/ParE family toxin [Burkholderia cenocepacia]MBG0880876.1 type II toxin-antitoxin system RelE/ParE family toxin [Burkholderia sp. 9775_39]MBG0888876.1 type II toxin-antitoxin system RelE/ParE family toxin [Burkholderia sp. 9773_38]PNF00651.1 type II toxin-antitoxin system RelE/ParE family toxin [Burkholderia cenocepacia]RSC47041.1 type II toxin-antitoxin system RelE/ParE family toxin [Burkholderia cenocepacia]
MAVKGRQLRLTPLAECDLEDIWRYTAEHWSPEQAEHYYRDLIGTMEALARGKKAGRICVVRDGYFRYPAGSHVVFYRETDETNLSAFLWVRRLNNALSARLHKSLSEQDSKLVHR